MLEMDIYIHIVHPKNKVACGRQACIADVVFWASRIELDQAMGASRYTMDQFMDQLLDESNQFGFGLGYKTNPNQQY